MIFLPMKVGTLENFVFLLGDEASRSAAVIDAGFEPERILRTAEENNLRLEKIFLTHFHYDHSGAAEKLAQMTGAEIFASGKGEWKREEEVSRGMWIVPPRFTSIDETTEISIGNIRGKVLETPGHQRDHLCFLFEHFLFSGDAVFIGRIGRTDFPDSDLEAVPATLKKIKSLPDETILCPGHDYGEVSMRTLAEEKIKNPFLSA